MSLGSKPTSQLLRQTNPLSLIKMLDTRELLELVFLWCLSVKTFWMLSTEQEMPIKNTKICKSDSFFCNL